MRETKFRYTCKRGNGNTFSQIFTLEQIEFGDAKRWIDVNFVGPFHLRKDQYTGRIDKRNKEIYEGDNVKPRSKSPFPPYEVYWDERACQFRLCANKDRQFDKTHPLDWAYEVIDDINEAP